MMAKIPEIKSCPLRDMVKPYPHSLALANAWHSAVLFSFTEPDVIYAFEQDTGIELFGAGGQIEEETLIEFLTWFNETIWKEDPWDGSKETL